MTERSNTPEESKPQGHRHDELAEVKQLIETYGKPVVTGLLVVMIAIVGFQFYTSRKEARSEAAARQMAAAKSIPDFEAVLENYGNTKTAPAALLAVAKLYYDNGNYEGALEKYDAFIAKNAEDPMVGTAELGRIFCVEARNVESSVREAAEAYAAFAAKYPESFLMPEAIFGQARCFEQLAKREEARAVYEDFIAKHADSAWVPRAEDLLDQVTRAIEKGASSSATPLVSASAATPAVTEVPTVEIPATAEVVAEAAPVAAEPK